MLIHKKDAPKSDKHIRLQKQLAKKCPHAHTKVVYKNRMVSLRAGLITLVCQYCTDCGKIFRYTREYRKKFLTNI